ncbi:hypothetical protein ACFQ3N_11570 [Virgibacillus byunsanensis]|uniref:Uncharacterized protein n=1 Tax=Virgibacillus byunsanensis TaxID=570945 RepID=A0ABW3LMW8_9BACI
MGIDQEHKFSIKESWKSIEHIPKSIKRVENRSRAMEIDQESGESIKSHGNRSRAQIFDQGKLEIDRAYTEIDQESGKSIKRVENRSREREIYQEYKFSINSHNKIHQPQSKHPHCVNAFS